jgi:N-acetylmuramoyl-L-alanine amidase
LQIIFFFHCGVVVRGIRIIFTCVFWHSVSWASLSDLTEKPDWSRLDKFQETMTSEEFLLLLKNVYCPRQQWWQPWFKLNNNEVSIRTNSESGDWYNMRFSNVDRNQSVVKDLDTITDFKIVLDPGHIGGRFSKMEGRHFQFGEDPPVKEGDLAYLVAKRLKPLLEKRGAKVFLTRKKGEPITTFSVSDFKEDAQKWASTIPWSNDLNKTEIDKKILSRQELYFYRFSEIRARKKFINRIRPDLVICLHLNAAPWADAENPKLVERNDYHILINGCYMGGELADENQRFEMIWRLFSRWNGIEKLLADKIALAFAEQTKLPAFVYKGPNALKVGEVEGVWARNLLANRIYQCPVVFLEPYVANSKEVYQRIQLGSYEDKRLLNDVLLKSLISEYADAVILGIDDALGW